VLVVAVQRCSINLASNNKKLSTEKTKTRSKATYTDFETRRACFVVLLSTYAWPLDVVVGFYLSIIFKRKKKEKPASRLEPSPSLGLTARSCRAPFLVLRGALVAVVLPVVHVVDCN
jgi:hypothetical protein